MTEVKGKENEITVEKEDLEALYEYAQTKRISSHNGSKKDPLYEFLKTYSPKFTTMSSRFGQGCLRSYDEFDPKTTGTSGEWIDSYDSFKRGYEREDNNHYCECCGQSNPGEYLSDILPLPEGEGSGFYYIVGKTHSGEEMSDIIIFRDYKKATESDKKVK